MRKLEPMNLRAQLEYRGRGNPPTTHPRSAISNCFPGLETDFRNVWKRILAGVEVHEASLQVIAVDPEGAAARAGVTTRHVLVAVAGRTLRPPNVPVANDTIEWNNALAEIYVLAGTEVECQFEVPMAQPTGQLSIRVMLPVRPLFEGITIAPDVAPPGALTQSLCSPWQNDYRECACFYWSANRPDFVNVETDGDTAAGHNWLDKTRQAGGPKQYVEDDPRNPDPRLVTYNELFQDWETQLKFQFGGQDEPLRSDG
jgi:hypothetical protein